jgi:aminoglycoside 6-adenylyltransferase
MPSIYMKRTAEEIKKIILDKAQTDDRIRAVLLNGSRANYKLQADPLQDFDILYLVNDLESFLADHSWTSIFGEKLIWQLPTEMGFGNEGDRESHSFSYLMLFEDGNRIDLTLFPKNRIDADFIMDSLTIVWLDKDNLFPNIPASDDRDYLIKVPSEKEFRDVCNEFWWVSTYVAKGLVRKEIIYTKSMMENPVRQMFMKIIGWYIGINTGFSVSLGKEGKYLGNYLSEGEYNSILKTYADYKSENIRHSLFLMTDLFSKFAKSVADKLNFKYNLEEQINTISWLLTLLKPEREDYLFNESTK